MLVFVLGKLCKKAKALDKERAREGVCQPRGTVRCALFPELSSVLGRARGSELSLPRRGVAGSGHIPKPSGASRRQAGEAKAGGRTWELSRVGGDEQKRGAKLSNCVRSPTRGGEREGRKVGGSREAASGLVAPEQPLSAAVAAATTAGPDSPRAQGVCFATRRARRLGRLPLRAPAPLLTPARAGPGGRQAIMQLQFRSWMLAALTLLVVFLIFADISEIEEEIG